MSWLSFRVKGRRPRQIATALGPQMEAVTTANEQDLLGAAQRAVHKITRKTEGSLAVIQEGPLRGHLVGRYGAVYEVARGGEHDFATAALDEVTPRARQRVAEGLTEAVGP